MSVSEATLTALQRTDDAFGILYRLELSGGGLSQPWHRALHPYENQPAQARKALQG